MSKSETVPSPSGSHYGRWRCQLCMRIVPEKLTPEQVATELEKHLSMFPKWETVLRAEIETLRTQERWL